MLVSKLVLLGCSPFDPCVRVWGDCARLACCNRERKKYDVLPMVWSFPESVEWSLDVKSHSLLVMSA